MDQIIKPIAAIYYLYVKLKEKQIGYRLNFNKLSDNWVQGTMASEMNKAWKRFSIAARGINFWTFGKVENGISTRFIPSSPYFQSWLGGYIVQFTDQRDWSPKDHGKLSEGDQKEWLSFFGDPRLFVETTKCKPVGKVNLGDYTGDLYYGQIESDIDIGNKKPFLLPFIMAAITSIMNKRSPKLKLSYKNLIPKYTEEFPLNPFQKILLEGYLLILNLDTKTKTVIYANAATFTDRNNKKYEHFKIIKDDLLEQIKNITIEKLS